MAGHVSPQFHVEFDDLFETMRPLAGNQHPKLLWQEKAGFMDADKVPRPLTQATVQSNHQSATPNEK